MVRKVVQKTSFLGGEAGYLLEGRSDLAQFQLGCNRLQNFITLRGGAATRRPGTRFVRETTGNYPAKLIEFPIAYDDTSQCYIVEMTLTSSTTIKFQVFCIDTPETQITPTGTQITAGVLTTSSAMTAKDLLEIQYTQVGGVIILTHHAFTPQVITKTSSSSFTINNYLFYLTVNFGYAGVLGVPYLDANTTTTTLSIDNVDVGTGRTLTASSSLFTANSIGSIYLVFKGSGVGSALVTGYTSATSVTVQVFDQFGGSNGDTSTVWIESAWSPSRGYPACCTLYDQRLIFGNTPNNPDTFWASETANYFLIGNDNLAIFGQTPEISDPQTFALASARVNEIRWMVGGKKLTIGTSTSEWVGLFDESGTDLVVQFDEETANGSAYIQPRKMDYTVPFVQRSRQIVREIVYDFYSDNYTATDLSLFSSHIGTPYGDFALDDVGIASMCYQVSPFNILWVFDNVGRLYGLTRDRQQQIASWHSHVIGGKLTVDGVDLPAYVTAMCSSPGIDGALDRLWLVVKRTIDGADYYHIEYIDDIVQNPDLRVGTATIDGTTKGQDALDPAIYPFLDCATVQNGTASASWTGFDRFASDTAYVVASDANGMICQAGPIDVASDGSIALNTATATSVCVGLNVNAEIRLLAAEGGDAPQLSMNSIKRPDKCAVRLYQAWGLRIGANRIMSKNGYVDNTTFEPIPGITDVTQVPTIPTYSGVKEVPIPSDADLDGSFALVMQEPWPCTVLSISTRVVNNEV